MTPAFAAGEFSCTDVIGPIFIARLNRWSDCGCTSNVSSSDSDCFADVIRPIHFQPCQFPSRAADGYLQGLVGLPRKLLGKLPITVHGNVADADDFITFHEALRLLWEAGRRLDLMNFALAAGESSMSGESVNNVSERGGSNPIVASRPAFCCGMSTNVDNLAVGRTANLTTDAVFKVAQRDAAFELDERRIGTIAEANDFVARFDSRMPRRRTRNCFGNNRRHDTAHPCRTRSRRR